MAGRTENDGCSEVGCLWVIGMIAIAVVGYSNDWSIRQAVSVMVGFFVGIGLVWLAWEAISDLRDRWLARRRKQ